MKFPRNEKEMITLHYEQRRRKCTKTPIPSGFHLSLTAGVGNIWKRVNCNEFVENLRADHKFMIGSSQNIDDIRSTIPSGFHKDFDAGLSL